MKTNKSLLFHVATLGFAVVLAVAAFLLVRGIIRLNSTENDLQTRKAELDGFYANNPFPSPGNVQRENENGKTLMECFRELLRLARKEQLQPAERSPSNFMSLLGDRRAQLSQLAASNNIILAHEFAFGFDRYFATGATLPAPEDVPRLTLELLMIDKLSTVLFEERVSEVIAIEREEFESAGGGATSRHHAPGRPAMQGAGVASAGIIAQGALLGKMHFVLELQAREKALLAVLNRLARLDLFVVVTGVNIEKEGSDIKTLAKSRWDEAPAPAAGTVTNTTTNAIPPRAERIISGLEVERPMRVTLDVDVYRFREGE